MPKWVLTYDLELVRVPRLPGGPQEFPEVLPVLEIGPEHREPPAPHRENRFPLLCGGDFAAPGADFR